MKIIPDLDLGISAANCRTETSPMTETVYILCMNREFSRH